MGKLFFIQHEIISKKIAPPFQLPQDKLLKTADLKNKAKPLLEYLKPSNKAPYTRKDLDPNWDACF